MGAKRECKRCGAEFERTSRGQINYCSAECLQLTYDRVYKGVRRCRQCKVAHTLEGPYCSDGCRDLYIEETRARAKERAKYVTTDPFIPRTDEEWEELNERVRQQAIRDYKNPASALVP